MPRPHRTSGERGIGKTSGGGLEVQLYAQLNFPRVMGGSDCSEVAGRERGADVLELRVVEGIETFRTEFETTATLIEHKALEERHVPVLATRTVDRVAWEVAKFAGRCG